MYYILVGFQTTLENCLVVLKKCDHIYSLCFINYTPRYIPNKIRTTVNQKICTKMFRAELFISTPAINNLNAPTI